MKKIITITSLYLIVTLTVVAQVKNPVHWSYSLKRTSNNQYEVHLLATIDEGWHIYAQKQLPEAIALPTKIKFDKMPGIVLNGKLTEVGKKETYIVAEIGITNYEYAHKIDFVQQMTIIKSGIKEVKGTVTWQSCTHKECLPSETLNFAVPVY